MSGVRKDTQAMYVQAIEEYYQGASYQELADKYGRHPTAFQKAIKLDREINGPRERVSKPRDVRFEKKRSPLGHAWTRLGSMIANFRMHNVLTPTSLGMLFANQKSCAKVGLMEGGFYDYTVAELGEVFTVLDLTPTEKAEVLLTFAKELGVERSVFAEHLAAHPDKDPYLRKVFKDKKDDE